MQGEVIAVAVAIVVALVAAALSRREHYGPPPGMARALTLKEIASIWDRGWAVWPEEYEADTASSISHVVDRSA